MERQDFDIGSGILRPTIKKGVIYVLVFLLALHVTPSLYVNSSLLSKFIGEEKVGLIFTISSILVLGSYLFIKRVLRKIGNYRVFMSMLAVDFLSSAVMAAVLLINSAHIEAFFISAFVICYVSRVLMILNLDIFLESQSADAETGGIRGFYLTSLNLAYVIGPLFGGLLIMEHLGPVPGVTGIAPVYIWASLLLIPMALIARKYLRPFVDGNYQKSGVFETLRKISYNFDLVKICGSSFVLNFFYSWMIIYMPIFLHSIGFSLSQVVSIVGIALIPFVLLQALAGKVADKILGEKELMTAGFIVAGLATLAISFIGSGSFWVWAGILFTTRIGACVVEIMNETYLFKKINANDVDILSLYRAIGESAYLIAPVIASIFLVFVIDIKYLFVALGIITLYGIRFSLTLKDTR
ncbi:MAG TPA: MFS transporter [Candidatus Paceibacterota bacterium]|nr:MFS transporter [Candidatus Paceibacterota bacterium]HRZ34640.1 MFS transporter [Candidatus Paceibacterota bacterium]